LHTAPLNRGSNDTEDDEMQELIQQLNSMKETLSLSQSSDDAPSSLSRRQRLFGPNEPVSLSHSSETIEPPQVQRRRRSDNSNVFSLDEEMAQYVSFDNDRTFWSNDQQGKFDAR
jgi:hypothetical protein